MTTLNRESGSFLSEGSQYSIVRDGDILSIALATAPPFDEQRFLLEADAVEADLSESFI